MFRGLTYKSNWSKLKVKKIKKVKKTLRRGGLYPRAKRSAPRLSFSPIDRNTAQEEVCLFNTGPPRRVPPDRRLRRIPLTRCMVTPLFTKSSLVRGAYSPPTSPKAGTERFASRSARLHKPMGFGPASKAKGPPDWNPYSAFDSFEPLTRIALGRLSPATQRGKFLKPPESRRTWNCYGALLRSHTLRRRESHQGAL